MITYEIMYFYLHRRAECTRIIQRRIYLLYPYLSIQHESFYRDGELPAHTKTAFKDLKVLTVHGIITKNALLLMHKVKYFKELLPVSIYQCIDFESPVNNDDSEAHSRWYSELNTEHFRKSVFLKGPLMYLESKIKDISASCDSIKRFLKSSLLDRQSSGEDEQWPTFQLYSINGIRRSKRTSSSATEVN